MIARLFWRLWAWHSLRLAEYHRDAAWAATLEQLVAIGRIPENTQALRDARAALKAGGTP